MAIASFRDKRLENLFETGKDPRVPPNMEKKVIRLLDHLDAASGLSDLNIAGFHPLKGDRRGTYAWKVTGNYRLTFRFDNGEASDVALEDYH